MDWETQTVFALAAVFAAVGYVMLVARRALSNQTTTSCGGCSECPNASETSAHGVPQSIELISIETTRVPASGSQDASRCAG